MTLRRFNFISFILIGMESALLHEWLGCAGWLTAALLQLDHVISEYEALQRVAKARRDIAISAE